MTEQEAREILDEHRTLCPKFRVGLRLYWIQRDGRRVDVYRLTRSHKRAIFLYTADKTDDLLPTPVRARLDD